MHAIILAAGRGSRLGPLGEDRPKCCVELAGMPLVARQLAALRRGGADVPGIVRGYRAEMLEPEGVALFDNPRWSQTNMVASLAAAASWLRREPVVVSYGDIFYPHELVRRLVAAPGDLVITYDRCWLDLWARRFEDPLSDAETFRVDAAGRLLEIGDRAGDVREIHGQYMGLLKFTPAAWHWVEQTLAPLDAATRDKLDMTGLLRRLLAQGHAIATVATEGGWGEVDNSDDLALYQRMVQAGELVLEDTEPPHLQDPRP